MIEGLLRWYAARCDGAWEHRYGFTIESCDNPGLQVTVDIATEPALRPEADRPLTQEGDDPGVSMMIRDRKLVAFAAPGRERQMLDRVDRFLARAPAG